MYAAEVEHAVGAAERLTVWLDMSPVVSNTPSRYSTFAGEATDLTRREFLLAALSTSTNIDVKRQKKRHHRSARGPDMSQTSGRDLCTYYPRVGLS